MKVEQNLKTMPKKLRKIPTLTFASLRKKTGFWKKLYSTRIAVPTIRDEKSTKKRYFTDTKEHLQRGTRSHFMYNGTFQEAIAPVLVMAQIFSVMPLHGVKGKDSSSLKFKWKSLRCFYSIFTLIFTTIYTAMTFLWAFSRKIEFSRIVPCIFYISNAYVMYCFIRLATQWPDLMKKWESVERKLADFKSQQEKAQLAYKIKMITMVIMTLSLSEHLLSLISAIHYANYCPGAKDPIESLFRGEMSQLFYFFEYHPVRASFGKCLNLICTFVWSFMDVFVMLVSVGLSSRFKQIYENLKRVKGLAMPEEFWMKSRNEYRMMCELCEEIDNAMAHITMVSFSNNLFFICVQLLNSLNTMPSFAHALYFWYSLVFLIGRTLAVSLYSAEINDESKRPIDVFRVVPRESWCLEVKRFSEEVTNDMVALSGMRFFHLTRQLVLSVAGTIVTYELVLIQFHEQSDAHQNNTDCKII